MDWEQFKARTAHLNRSRTEEERIQIFRESAKSSYRHFQTHLKVEETRRRAREGLGPLPDSKQPQRLSGMAFEKVKVMLYDKEYIELLLHVTNGEGIFPRVWDAEAERRRDKVVKIRSYQESDILDWIRENFHD